MDERGPEVPALLFSSSIPSEYRSNMDLILPGNFLTTQVACGQNHSFKGDCGGLGARQRRADRRAGREDDREVPGFSLWPDKVER